ncbi:hypothetical protein KAR91_71560 [Candidatus Pacearchaeota archaeon]|nr:hypothetical protein [Candidatus Pacearchaeota archaeon]
MIDTAGRTRRTDIITQNGGYKGGYVYIASVEGRAGILPNLNGTLLDPVNSFSNAYTIMNLSKIRNLYVLPQSPATQITLTASFAGFNINGRDFNVFINGQNVDHTHFLSGHIMGIFVGIPHFEHCEAMDLEGAGCYMFDTALDGYFTNNANDAVWLLNGCYTKTPGQDAVTFDFGVAKTNVALMLRHHSGGMHLHNMAAGHAMTAEGFGQIVIDSNCTGGSISVRGAWQVTDNSGGAVTITYDDSTDLIIDMPAAIDASTILAKEATINTSEANRVTMEATLVAEHDATQVAIGSIAEPDNTSITTILSEVQNVTYGLAATKTLIDTIDAAIDAVDTSSELAARFTEIKGAGFTNENLENIKNFVDDLETRITQIRAGGMNPATMSRV